MNAGLSKQLLDQTAHIAAAFAVLAPVLVLPGMTGGALSGCAAGLVREITEGGNVFSKGSAIDLLFWTLGGALGAHLLQ